MLAADFISAYCPTPRYGARRALAQVVDEVGSVRRRHDLGCLTAPLLSDIPPDTSALCSSRVCRTHDVLSFHVPSRSPELAPETPPDRRCCRTQGLGRAFLHVRCPRVCSGRFFFEMLVSSRGQRPVLSEPYALPFAFCRTDVPPLRRNAAHRYRCS